MQGISCDWKKMKFDLKIHGVGMDGLKKKMKENGWWLTLALGFYVVEEMVSARVIETRNKKSKVAKVWIKMI